MWWLATKIIAQKHGIHLTILKQYHAILVGHCRMFKDAWNIGRNCAIFGWFLHDFLHNYQDTFILFINYVYNEMLSAQFSIIVDFCTSLKKKTEKICAPKNFLSTYLPNECTIMSDNLWQRSFNDNFRAKWIRTKFITAQWNIPKWLEAASKNDSEDLRIMFYFQLSSS